MKKACDLFLAYSIKAIVPLPNARAISNAQHHLMEAVHARTFAGKL
jgi:hypothetical protein